MNCNCFEVRLGLIAFLLSFLTLNIAFGDDTESDFGLCLRGFADHCGENKTLAHDLYGRILLWNTLCNPPIDEQFCKTGTWSK